MGNTINIGLFLRVIDHAERLQRLEIKAFRFQYQCNYTQVKREDYVAPLGKYHHLKCIECKHMDFHDDGPDINTYTCADCGTEIDIVSP